jgi:hypothetical protein
MSNPNGTKFAEGERVNVTIRNAHVVSTSGDMLPTAIVRVENQFGEWRFEIPTAYPGVDVERIAPAEWPPQHRDGWKSERNGWEWFAVKKDSGRIMLVNDYGDSYDPAWAMENTGPMTLTRREGWTPAAPVDVGEPAPVDERAAWVAGIREIADLVEARRDLPVPYGNAGQVEFDTRAELERVAREFGVDITDTERHDRAELKFGPTLLNLCWFKPTETPAEPELVDEDGDGSVDGCEREASFPCAWLGGCNASVGVRNEICDRHEAPGAPLPHRVPAPDAEAMLAATLDGEVPA